MAAPGFPVQISPNGDGVDGTVTTREQVSGVDASDYEIYCTMHSFHIRTMDEVAMTFHINNYICILLIPNVYNIQ
jgi:hypothetical protein